MEMNWHGMLKFAVEYNGPIAIRYPRGSYKDSITEKNIIPEIKLCQAEILEKGNDITIIGLGKTVTTALEVAKLLKKKKINAEVINARFLKPLDKSTILESIRKTKKVVTIEDNVITGGLANAIKDLIINENITYKKFFAYPDEFIKHGTISEIEHEYQLDTKSIASLL